ncbi:MAG: heme biosynthesis HemY N-terminal domain-containing protein, partial [Giesbergeria sp.]
MRATLWLLALFAVAVASALFAGNNQGTITVFWPPWRLDLSLNLVLLALALAFTTLYAALRGFAALVALPRQAQRWRLQQKERAMHGAMLDALAQLMSGRFLRSRKAAEAALEQEASLRSANAKLPQAESLRVLAHLVAADASHALQDRSARERHLEQALQPSATSPAPLAQDLREGTQMRAARWALDDREPQQALEGLA